MRHFGGQSPMHTARSIPVEGLTTSGAVRVEETDEAVRFRVGFKPTACFLLSKTAIGPTPEITLDFLVSEPEVQSIFDAIGSDETFTAFLSTTESRAYLGYRPGHMPAAPILMGSDDFRPTPKFKRTRLEPVGDDTLHKSLMLKGITVDDALLIERSEDSIQVVLCAHFAFKTQFAGTSPQAKVLITAFEPSRPTVISLVTHRENAKKIFRLTRTGKDIEVALSPQQILRMEPTQVSARCLILHELARNSVGVAV
jgi:hypothetical protein